MVTLLLNDELKPTLRQRRLDCHQYVVLIGTKSVVERQPHERIGVSVAVGERPPVMLFRIVCRRMERQIVEHGQDVPRLHLRNEVTALRQVMEQQIEHMRVVRRIRRHSW